MIVPFRETVKRACIWHALTPPTAYVKPDPAWARRYLLRCERDGDVTRDEADHIRYLCGWQTMRLI